MFDKNLKVGAVYCDGISTFTPNYPISVTVNEEERQVSFDMRFSKVPNANLSFDKITNIAWVTEKDVKDASVIGSAIVGGVLFGGLGAVVGAVAGTKKKSETYLVINYTAADGTVKAISMKANGDLKIFKLEKAIKKHLSPASVEELEL
jgi:hypothetical protein